MRFAAIGVASTLAYALLFLLLALPLLLARFSFQRYATGGSGESHE